MFDKKTRSAYIYGDDRQWLGLENSITMFLKASYMKAYNLAGIMIYSLASDDYKVLFVREVYKIILGYLIFFYLLFSTSQSLIFSGSVWAGNISANKSSQNGNTKKNQRGKSEKLIIELLEKEAKK